MQLEAVYRKYHREIFAVAVHCLMDSDAAEDVVQETFIRYFQNEAKIQGNPKNWLYRVAINRCFDYRRYLKKFSRDLVETLVGHDNSNDFELSDEIKNVLKPLSAKERAVVTFKYMEEMNYEEISEIMGIPVGSLKSISSRALKKMNKKGRKYE